MFIQHSSTQFSLVIYAPPAAPQFKNHWSTGRVCRHHFKGTTYITIRVKELWLFIFQSLEYVSLKMSMLLTECTHRQRLPVYFWKEENWCCHTSCMFLYDMSAWTQIRSRRQTLYGPDSEVSHKSISGRSPRYEQHCVFLSLSPRARD